MDEFLNMIAERKLNLTFSKYAVFLTDGTSDTTYIEYHSKPMSNPQLAVVHPTIYDAMMTVLGNCFNGVTSPTGLVMSKP